MSAAPSTTRSAKVDCEGVDILAATTMQTMPPKAGTHRTAMSFLKLLAAFVTGTSALILQRVYVGNRGGANDSRGIVKWPMGTMDFSVMRNLRLVAFHRSSRMAADVSCALWDIRGHRCAARTRQVVFILRRLKQDTNSMATVRIVRKRNSMCTIAVGWESIQRSPSGGLT